MSMRINNNIYSLNAYRHLSDTQSKLSTSIERLSSGFRINSAADDAAGLAISEKLRSQISGYEIAAQNAQDGISIVQTADGALDRTHTILRRMRDLTELAANGDKTDADRAHYQEEVDQLLDEIDRIGATTEYNTKKLLDGSVGSKASEVGDIDDISQATKLKVVSTPQMDGEYEVVVTQAATKATAMFTTGNDNVNIAIDDSFSDFVDAATVGTAAAATGENDGTYTFRFSMDNKEVTVDLIAKDGAGDTIAEAIGKINDAMDAAGMEGHAKFNADVDTTDTLAAIEIEADNFGSAHDIRIAVVNQPQTVYNDLNFVDTAGGTDSYNAVEGTAGAIYNSDRSGATGVIHEDTIFLQAAAANSLQSLVPLATQDIRFTDKTGATADFSVVAGDTLAEIATDITDNLGLELSAVYDSSGGNFKIFSTGSGSDPIIIEASGNGVEAEENQMAAMLGIFGTHYGSSVEGERVTSTTDYHLTITAPEDTSTVEVFAKFGNRNTKFDAIKSDSAVTESQDDPDQLGSELPGAGGISGIEFQLEEKTLAGAEQFSILVSRGELEIQVGANEGSDNRMGIAIDKVDTNTLNMNGLDISTQANAQSVLDSGVIDTAIESISTTRAKLGAMQNRLNHTIANLSITKENLASAESRIRDTDFAKETMEFTKRQIMAQAGTSMLQQANLMPQLVLSLLG